jgi:hypothetical protein
VLDRLLQRRFSIVSVSAELAIAKQSGNLPQTKRFGQPKLLLLCVLAIQEVAHFKKGDPKHSYSQVHLSLALEELDIVDIDWHAAGPVIRKTKFDIQMGRRAKTRFSLGIMA